MIESLKLLPLEKYLYYRCKNSGNFPKMNFDYFLSYYELKKFLNQDYYSTIDKNAGYISGDYYTHHGLDHVNDVINFSGKLLGITDTGKDEIQKNDLITDYAVFVLLCSILLHDAGMWFGRDAHEKKCFDILLNYKSLFGNDSFEIKSISRIAEAHSGKFNGSDDTLSNPDLRIDHEINGHKFNAKSLAAIVRFADEICENKERADRFALDSGLVRNKSFICHKYCSYISSSQVLHAAQQFIVKFIVPKSDVICKFNVNGKELFIFDEIFSRINKMNKERVYCCRYFYDIVYIRKIVANFEIIDENYNPLHEFQIELEDKGYPSDVTTIEDIYPQINGKLICDKISNSKDVIVEQPPSGILRRAIGSLKSRFRGV